MSRSTSEKQQEVLSREERNIWMAWIGTFLSVLRRHANDYHNGVIPDYVMNVTGVYCGDAMLRQITESIKIRREGSINNKEGMELYNIAASGNSEIIDGL